MEASRTLRLVGVEGEVPDDAPASYAEALVEISNLRGQRDNLKDENDHLTEALKRTTVEGRRLRGQLNKDLRLHKDYAAAERLWGKYRQFHPRSPEEIPDDYLKMAIHLLKGFDEAYLSRALDGAKANPPVNKENGTVYDGWANIFRNAGNMESYVKRADQTEDRKHREKDPGVAKVLSELCVAKLEDLAARCECGHLMVVHALSKDAGGKSPCSACDCEDGDDLWWRAEQWKREQDRGGH